MLVAVNIVCLVFCCIAVMCVDVFFCRAVALLGALFSAFVLGLELAEWEDEFYDE